MQKVWDKWWTQQCEVCPERKDDPESGKQYCCFGVTIKLLVKEGTSEPHKPRKCEYYGKEPFRHQSLDHVTIPQSLPPKPLAQGQLFK